MYFNRLSLQHFASTQKSLPNHPLDITNVLRLRKLRRYYIYIL